jgi:hypothetical protein
LVESVANTGVFGPRYLDDNHLGVVPAFLAGVLLAIEVAALRIAESQRRRAGGARGWLAEAAAGSSAGSWRRDLPYVLAFQFAALFAIETAEQIVAGGRSVAGSGWLGAPAPVGIVTHAAIGTAFLFVLCALVRALAATCGSLLTVALEFVLLPRARQPSAPYVRRVRFPACRCAQSPHSRQIGERAPPLAAPA